MTGMVVVVVVVVEVVVFVGVVEFVVPAGGAGGVPATVSTAVGFALAGLGAPPVTATTDLEDPPERPDEESPTNPMPPLPEPPLVGDPPPFGAGAVACDGSLKLGTSEELELDEAEGCALISGRIFGPVPTLKPVTAHSVAAATAKEATTPRPKKPGALVAMVFAASTTAVGTSGDECPKERDVKTSSRDA